MVRYLTSAFLIALLPWKVAAAMPHFSQDYYMMLNPYPSGRIIPRMPQYVPPPASAMPVIHHPDGSVSDPRLPFQVKPATAFEPDAKPMVHIKRQPVATSKPAQQQASLPFESKPKESFKSKPQPKQVVSYPPKIKAQPQPIPHQMPIQQERSIGMLPTRPDSPMLLPLPEAPQPQPVVQPKQSASMDVSLPPVPYIDEGPNTNAQLPSTGVQPMLLPLPDEK